MKNEEEQKQERTTQETTFESETNEQTKANQVKMLVLTNTQTQIKEF